MPKHVENYEHSITDLVTVATMRSANTRGTVLALRTTVQGRQYEVKYSNGAAACQAWFCECDLKAVKEPASCPRAPDFQRWMMCSVEAKVLYATEQLRAICKTVSEASSSEMGAISVTLNMCLTATAGAESTLRGLRESLERSELEPGS